MDHQIEFLNLSSEFSRSKNYPPEIFLAQKGTLRPGSNISIALHFLSTIVVSESQLQEPFVKNNENGEISIMKKYIKGDFFAIEGARAVSALSSMGNSHGIYMNATYFGVSGGKHRGLVSFETKSKPRK